MQIVFDANFNAGGRRRHVKKAGDCRRLSENSRDEARAAEGFAKEIAGARSGSLVPRVVLCKENVFAALRTQIMKGLSQDVFLSS